ncbi:hypothetical protein HMPREF0063_11677 [Aeromicrobium marinum DSM 15272]|uniref:Copper chaperone PCu(A)C n=2 Tax=Aeromicrobium marinum TaxID=219314 RepID=E2SD91_9ACTN|nr:hypothetical protein HMPREF0063_11677 [Aeromicrobium marinum DSM 15272]
MAGLVLATAGCDADPPQHERSSGQVERTESVTAANLVIVVDGDGRGVLIGTLLNRGPGADRLVDVDAEGESLLELPIAVDLVGGPVTLPSDEPVRLAEQPEVVLSSVRLVPGFRAPLELTFAESDPIVTTVRVEARTGPYADVSIPPAGE